MKRAVIGILLLAVLLAGGILSSRSMLRSFSPMGDILEQASQAALEGSWEQVTALTRQARQHWDSRWRSTAAFADHAPMEQIDGLFARLEVYCAAKTRDAYAAVCAQLSKEIASMGEAHAFVWWNVL